MRTIKAICAALVLAIAVTACVGGSIGRIAACTGVAPPQLLYPMPGTTGFMGARLTLFFAFPHDPAPAFGQPQIVPMSGGSTVIGSPYATPSPGPMPPGSATPRPGYDQVFVSVMPTYAPTTTYSVVLPSACGPNNIGSFSTQ